MASVIVHFSRQIIIGGGVLFIFSPLRVAHDVIRARVHLQFACLQAQQLSHVCRLR